MSKPKKDEPVPESSAPVSHEEMVRRLKADPLCVYHDEDDGEGVTIVGGIDHHWAVKHIKARRKRH